MPPLASSQGHLITSHHLIALGNALMRRPSPRAVAESRSPGRGRELCMRRPASASSGDNHVVSMQPLLNATACGEAVTPREPRSVGKAVAPRRLGVMPRNAAGVTCSPAKRGAARAITLFIFLRNLNKMRTVQISRIPWQEKHNKVCVQASIRNLQGESSANAHCCMLGQLLVEVRCLASAAPVMVGSLSSGWALCPA